jgi:hypothetical protein
VPTADGFAGANFLSLGTETSSSPPAPPAGRVHKDLENHEIDLNSPPVDQYERETKGEGSTTYSTTQEEEEEVSNSNNNNRTSGTGLGRGRLQQQFSEVKNCRSSRGSSLNSKFQQQEGLVYKSPEEAAKAYDVGIHSTSLSLSRISQSSHKDLTGKSLLHS